ncbi:MAG TPA: PspC domain-containing protein [Candidatus Enterenecus stercoripullorum]|nr:PspC domain-containing protein [Candidatus Enterenecus stercoripullorum]
MKRLYRTTSSDAVLCGVCGGIARYLGVDPTVVRLITAALVFVGGLSLWVYVIAALLMPKESAMWR